MFTTHFLSEVLGGRFPRVPMSTFQRDRSDEGRKVSLEWKNTKNVYKIVSSLNKCYITFVRWITKESGTNRSKEEWCFIHFVYNCFAPWGGGGSVTMTQSIWVTHAMCLHRRGTIRYFLLYSIYIELSDCDKITSRKLPNLIVLRHLLFSLTILRYSKPCLGDGSCLMLMLFKSWILILPDFINKTSQLIWYSYSTTYF